MAYEATIALAGGDDSTMAQILRHGLRRFYGQLVLVLASAINQQLVSAERKAPPGLPGLQKAHYQHGERLQMPPT